MKAWFGNIQVDVGDLDNLFHVFDTGDGEIGIEEFIDGIHRMKGYSNRMDVLALLKLVKKNSQKTDEIVKTLSRMPDLISSSTPTVSYITAPSMSMNDVNCKQPLLAESNREADSAQTPQAAWDNDVRSLPVPAIEAAIQVEESDMPTSQAMIKSQDARPGEELRCTPESYYACCRARTVPPGPILLQPESSTGLQM
eukprot:gnl/TRDRNA2_/TRDRNA2_164747_c2_seq1.p1 gnl/TRDRNA2_/TRDRNA2_164747_c2~~gnl/TRDRNA2_/TRDRNA2_164747_c2_seq1.p1  ORF type:complete len:197 (+),score=30.22 gnl/TRDRNA2_/TRDRNA2_164747_c2_seq1:34-624(+)